MKEFVQKLRAKQKMKYTFTSAGLYISKKLSNGKEARRYPKIHDIQLEDGYVRYVFTLLNGMDPKELKKKEYVFQQVFGRNLELRGDMKRFVLYVYTEEMKEVVRYDAETMTQAVKHLKLPALCGADRHGRIVSYDMTVNPHILIGGRTGWGKSTQLRQLLTTMILTKTPEELELYLGDCKKAEFHLFRNVEHVKANLVQEKDIARMIEHIADEMDKRSDLLDAFAVEHIDKLPADKKKPYIVLCIDEVIKLSKNQHIMNQLIDLTSLGRALGIFVILSMQRPVGKVIDTTVRANLNVAMGFRVRDVIEARVLSTPGAEKLPVPGRFYMDIEGDMTEVQAPFLTLEEAQKLLEPYKIAPENARQVFDEDVQPASEDEEQQIFGRWIE
ncbi:DNA translocase FtsK [Bacillus atrophaeus]|uniref:FtsK/SpoIIIE domain-containing protein n=1 Tax=Bacillus atrophaeus TaxID=1452 RepID=UPI00228262DC|nr:FtsK/SpoIIIE domain-containing protein [Bacillus atrophaeus]MCY9198909.1 DNA translocase FtsK [Bacillus atrophaeus]